MQPADYCLANFIDIISRFNRRLCNREDFFWHIFNYHHKNCILVEQNYSFLQIKEIEKTVASIENFVKEEILGFEVTEIVAKRNDGYFGEFPGAIRVNLDIEHTKIE